MAEKYTVDQFVEKAESFCLLIEQHHSLADRDFANQCAQCLSGLYQSAILLSRLAVNVDTENLIEDAVSYDQAQVICGEVGDKFGNCRYYWEVFDPYEAEAPVAGDLGDDLADIYRDVKDGLAAFNKGTANESLWHWQHSFRSHWGDHLVTALRAIHHIIFRRLLEDAHSDFALGEDIGQQQSGGTAA